MGYFCFSACNACMCVLNTCACVLLLIFRRTMSIFGGNILQVTTGWMCYVRFKFTHRAHVQWRVLAVLTCVLSFIIERIFSKIGGNILRVTTSYMGYVLVICTHLVCVRELCTCILTAHACMHSSRTRIRLSLDEFSPNLLQTYYRSPRVSGTTYFSCLLTACACANMCALAYIGTDSVTSYNLHADIYYEGRNILKVA
jgi:hypothetical protein